MGAFRLKRSTVTTKIRKNEARNPDDFECLLAVMDILEARSFLATDKLRLHDSTFFLHG